MNKWQAIDKFWNSFGIPAYDETSVPEFIIKDGKKVENKPPYITYNCAVGNLGQPVGVNASVWYESNSWQAISLKVDEISEYIGYGGKVIPIENEQFLWVKKGTPFAQRMSDTNDKIRRVYLLVEIDFLTEN